MDNALTGIVLGLASALFHGMWNVWAKRSEQPLVFMFLMGIVGVVISVPYIIVYPPHVDFQTFPYLAFSGVIVGEALYLILLSLSYKYGKLSIAYPLTRGIPPLLLMVVTPLVIVEKQTTLLGVVGVFVVIAGMYCMFLPSLKRIDIAHPFTSFNTKGNRLAVATAILIALYTLCYKIVLQHVPPIPSLSFTFVVNTVVIGGLLLAQGKSEHIRKEIYRNGWLSILSGVLSFTSFVMFLYATDYLPLVYITAVRNMSIVFTVGFSAVFLREKVSSAHWLGVACICIGCVLIAFR